VGMRNADHTRLFTSPFLLSLCLMYPFSVYAADELTAFGIPLAKFGYILLMASWGALASILQRFAKEEFPTGKAFVVAMCDWVNACLAATIVFLMCETWAVKPSITAVMCSLAGFGGSRFMTAIYLRFEARAAKVVEGDTP
jgi:purine-cytosine permease-like protein